MSLKVKEMIKEQMGRDVDVLGPDDTFKFTCTACGACCTNRAKGGEIILSPYDIFQLAKGLSMNIGDIISKHTKFNYGGQSKLPMFTISNKIKFDGSSVCTFLRAKGDKKLCSVHEFKPSACSLYPLGRFIDNENNKLMYINQKDGCSNRIKKDTHEHKVSDWIPSLENSAESFIEYSTFINKLYEILDVPNFINSDDIKPTYKNLFTSLYVSLIFNNYDMEKDFLSQLKDNENIMLKIVENLSVIVLLDFENSQKAFKKIFKNDIPNIDEADAMMNIVMIVDSIDMLDASKINFL